VGPGDLRRQEVSLSSEKKAKPSIKLIANGPYIVNDLEDLRNQKGPMETQPRMALCRCGGSENKPFCDGSHAKIDFSSDKVTGRIEDKRENYEGDGVTIHDNRGICAHAGRCTDGLPSVFRLGQEPWIDPKGAPSDEIVSTVKQCPSGALSYSGDGENRSDAEDQPSIFVSPNGPYVVTGGPELHDTDRGEGASKEHFTLCRCGGSKNKPFCDGSHWYRKFTDDKN
jgi:CDGSH-type Zn-finger protein